MFLRVDKLLIELPMPKKQDPNADRDGGILLDVGRPQHAPDDARRLLLSAWSGSRGRERP